MIELFRENIIDEFTITVISILVGEGTKLFSEGRAEQNLELVSTKRFTRSSTWLHHQLAKSKSSL